MTLTGQEVRYDEDETTKAKWSAVLTSAAMLMINIPVSAEEQSQYINGVTQIMDIQN